MKNDYPNWVPQQGPLSGHLSCLGMFAHYPLRMPCLRIRWGAFWGGVKVGPAACLGNKPMARTRTPTEHHRAPTSPGPRSTHAGVALSALPFMQHLRRVDDSNLGFLRRRAPGLLAFVAPVGLTFDSSGNWTLQAINSLQSPSQKVCGSMGRYMYV